MTVAHEGQPVVVKIRTPRRDVMRELLLGCFWLVLAGASWTTRVQPGPPSWSVWAWIAAGGAMLGLGLWLGTLGVDLSPESATVRGLRRQTIPWTDVQEVAFRRRLDAWLVQLITTKGKRVTLRATTMYRGQGALALERDYYRIGQWFRAHQDPSGRPADPEPPGQS
ncbi:MAG: hypothetical protein ACYCTH_03135 [Cellulomonas sp.]